MLGDLLKIVGVSVGYLGLFWVSELIHRKTDTEPEITRKMVHVLSGIISILFPFLFSALWPILVLAVFFLGIIWFSKRKGYLPSIHKVDRKTIGGYLYPLAILFCFWIFLRENNILYYFIPVIVLAVSDPSAAFFGKLFPKGRYTFWGETKTLVGSAAFFLSAVAIIIFCLHYERLLITDNWMFICFVALAGTVAEGLGRRGEDNLWIPLAVTGAMYIIHFQ